MCVLSYANTSSTHHIRFGFFLMAFIYNLLEDHPGGSARVGRTIPYQGKPCQQGLTSMKTCPTTSSQACWRSGSAPGS